MSDDLKLYQKAALDLGAGDIVYVSRADGSADGKATMTSLASLIGGELSFFSWSNITGTPTTLAGYGITDAATINDAVTADDSTWSSEKIADEIADVTGGIGALLIANNLSDLASAGTARTNLGLAIGSNVQAYSANLTSFATVAPAANVLTFLGAADYAAMRTQLSLGTAALLASTTSTTLAGNSDANLPTEKAVKAYVDAQFAGAGTGTVTHTAGALTLNQLVFGNGAADLKAGNLTGDVTTSGGTATTIANDAVVTAKILNANVTLAKLANIADQTILGNNTGGAAAPVALTAAQVKVVLAPAIQSVTSSATVTPTFANDQVNITAQAAALALANPTGTAIPAWGLVIRIKDNGTARAITYDTQYRAIGVTLPTTTVISKTLYLGMIFNSTDTKWDVVAVAQEA